MSKSDKPKSVAKNSINNFEQSINQLEQIVKQMETGELGLEDSLSQFEQGIKLAKTCQDTLTKVELKVEQLIEKNGLLQTVPFEQNNE